MTVVYALATRSPTPATRRRANDPPTRTTRHHHVDEEFVAVLEEDFGIPEFALRLAFLGMPPEPKKGAIALCEWATRADDPARALLSWARKNGRGTFAVGDVDGEDA